MGKASDWSFAAGENTAALVSFSHVISVPTLAGGVHILTPMGGGSSVGLDSVAMKLLRQTHSLMCILLPYTMSLLAVLIV